jgi:hypothetical protein
MKTLSLILSILFSLSVCSQNVIYWESIDTNIVKTYLHQSFNEFRLKHGKTTVLTNDSLSKECGRYSKRLITDYRHASETERGNLIECIGKSSFYYYNYKLHPEKPIMVDPKKVNTNKMVANILFEIFEISKSHMDLLMSDYKVYGFGFTISQNYFYVVVRGK